MKKIASMGIMLLIAAALLPAQEAAAPETGGLYEISTEHYTIFSGVSSSHAEETGRRMEALFDTYNEWFHFDPAALKAPLKVKIMTDQTDFNAFLQKMIPETREDFVYLHYSRPDRSLLLGYRMEEPDYSKSLAHQGFIQFIKAFVNHPPLWLREGFAVFFETARWDKEAGKLVFEENLAWLPAVKKLYADYGREGLIPLKELLTMKKEDLEAQPNIAIPQAWALVSFLSQTDNRRYNRVLWDSVASLNPSATLAVNSEKAAETIFRWTKEEKLTEEYYAYIESRRSFKELVEGGILDYSEGSYDRARTSFQKALARDESYYIPYYYLGLIAYAQENYEQADYYYEMARETGGPADLMDYAQGVNAYAAEQIDSAETYLTRVKQENPDQFGPKAEDILTRIETFY